MRPDRSEEFMAYYESLPLEDRGRLMIALWLNAVATLAVQAALLVLVVRTGRRLVSTDHPVAPMLEGVLSPGAALVAIASAGHLLVRQRLRRRLDQRICAAKTAD
jgi:hypothetical protein